MATEVTTQQAAEILGTSQPTIWRRVRDGTLPARREGKRGMFRINLEQLRLFADKQGYLWDEKLAQRIEKET